MGDSCCADYSIGAVRELIERELPGVFVHSINTGLGGSSVADIFSSYFGSLNDQVSAALGAACGWMTEAVLCLVAWRAAGLRNCQPDFMSPCATLVAPAVCCTCIPNLPTRAPILHLSAQVARVCDELLALEELKDGYVAVGFSQVRGCIPSAVLECVCCSLGVGSRLQAIAASSSPLCGSACRSLLTHPPPIRAHLISLPTPSRLPSLIPCPRAASSCGQWRSGASTWAPKCTHW